jgi:hypothetical protein
MKPFRILAASVLAACLSTAVVTVACRPAPSASSTTPPPAASAHKFGLGVNNTNEIGNQLAEQGLFEWQKNWSDGTDSGGSLAEIVIDGIGPGPINIPISQCQFVTSAALTASQTTYATINVYKRPGNNPDGGLGATLIASASTTTNQADAAADAASTGSWFAWQNVVVPASANAFVAPGDVITVAITKTSTGVGVPQGVLTCYTTIL